MKAAEILVVSRRGVISDFGLSAQGVLGKTPLYLAVKVSLRVALEEILKKICISNSFYLLDSCNQSLKRPLLGIKKIGLRPEWSPLIHNFRRASPPPSYGSPPRRGVKHHPYCLKEGNKLKKKVTFTKPGNSCFDFSVICVLLWQGDIVYLGKIK